MKQFSLHLCYVIVTVRQTMLINRHKELSKLQQITNLFNKYTKYLRGKTTVMNQATSWHYLKLLLEFFGISLAVM